MIRFAESYGNLVHAIMSESSSYDMNLRTRCGISYLPEGYSFVMNLGDNILPTCGLRVTRPHLAAAEVAWCFMGSTSLGWLRRHTKIWDAFADGNDEIVEAYGHRWRHAFDYDQLKTAIDRLKKDPSDRRIFISSWDPRHDLIDSDQKTVPCPVGFTLSISESQFLNSTLLIRSSDVFIGLPIDVMRHALVMRAIANSLNIKLGFMRVTLAHPHIYESHWDSANKMLEQEIMVPEIQMPKIPWDIDMIAEMPDDYVALIRAEAATTVGWPTYSPRATVVK